MWLVVNHNNNQNKIGVQKEQTDSTIKQQIDLDGVGMLETHNLNGVNVARVSIEMPVKIRYGIRAEGDDSSAYPRFTLHSQIIY